MGFHFDSGIAAKKENNRRVYLETMEIYGCCSPAESLFMANCSSRRETEVCV